MIPKEEDLYKFQNELDRQRQQLLKWETDLRFDKAKLQDGFEELEKDKKTFDVININALNILRERANDLAQREDKINNKDLELTKKLSESEIKHYELLSRESSVSRREAFLISVIEQLKV